MLVAKRRVGEAQPDGGAGREVLHEHVRPFKQPGEHVLRLRMLDVQREALLRAIGPHEMRGQASDPLVIVAGEVAAAGALDLDHAGAEIGELARAERRRNRVFEGHDGDAIKRSHRLTPRTSQR